MQIPILDMIVRADWMARIIVMMLTIISLITWAIIFNRFYVLGQITKGNRLFRKNYSSLSKITDIENLDSTAMNSPMAQLGQAGALEYKRIIEDAQMHTGVKDWSFFLQNQFAMGSEHIHCAFMSLVSPFDKGVLMLAMTSSIAPFLGLLGTVWGIMISFFDIGNQGSASLPVVAPGIAAALITTIFGLAVAIPALFFYNYFTHKADKIEDEMDEFKEMLLARLKREIFSLLYSDKNTGRTLSQGQNS